MASKIKNPTVIKTLNDLNKCKEMIRELEILHTKGKLSDTGTFKLGVMCGQLSNLTEEVRQIRKEVLKE